MLLPHTNTHTHICIRKRTSNRQQAYRNDSNATCVREQLLFHLCVSINRMKYDILSIDYHSTIHSIALKTSDKSKLCKSSFMAFLRFSSVVCYLNDIKAIKLYYDILLIHKRSFSDRLETRFKIDNRTVSTPRM